jgi:hypothetical protein
VLLGLGAQAGLLYLRNVHGGAALVGAALAIAFIAIDRVQRAARQSR